jgi:subtilisin family serine protease
MHPNRLLFAAAMAVLAAAAPVAQAGTVVLKLGAHASQRRLAQAGMGATVARVAGTGARLVRTAGDPAAVAARLERTHGVRWAEPNFAVHALAAVPNDAQWPALSGVRRIGAPAFWAAHALGAFPALGGVPIGIVDTGIDTGHEDLAGKVLACGAAADGVVTDGDCADTEGHGTHVAGTVGALANNGVGVAGVAFSSPLIVCRALGGPEGSGTVADVAACIRWAHVRGAKVISMSLGGPASHTLAEAAKTAYARGGRSGSLLVAAAGNDGDGSTNYPAGLDQVVSVGAVDGADAVAPFSNENADVELAAPGVDVLSTRLGGGYVRMSGTSMATPHASAAAALLWSATPSATASLIRRRLDAAVDDLGAPGRDPAYGYGVVDIAAVR